MNEINILYTVDNNYLKYMMISLLSLLENNKDFKKINIHVIYTGFSNDDFKRLENILSNYDNCNIYFYKYNSSINEYQSNVPKWRGTNIANVRLFFNDYIKNVDKILYLDSDTLIVDSLSNLPNSNKAVMACLDHLSQKYWNNLDKSLEKYCNSGVLWINNHEWDNQNCSEKIINTIDRKLKLEYPDQDILNISLKDDISVLPLNYNLFPTEYYYDFNSLLKFYKINEIDFYDDDEVKSAISNPIIFHLMEIHGIRPWQKNIIYPFNKEFDKYYIQLFDMEKKKNYNWHQEFLFKEMDYLRIYVPKEIKDEVKKLIRK